MLVLCRRFGQAQGCGTLAGRTAQYARPSAAPPSHADRDPTAIRPRPVLDRTVTPGPRAPAHPAHTRPVRAHHLTRHRTVAPPEPFSVVEASGGMSAGRLGEVRSLMKSSLLIIVGTLITVAGIIFGLQGLGYIGGSVMSGVTFWAVVGPLIALAGIAMAVFGVRARRSAS
jgi:hypothetical protein